MPEPISVLQIEDSPLVVQFTRAMLVESTTGSFILTCAESLAEGLRQLADNKFDVVLLDLTLPDSHGLDTFLELRAAASPMPTVIYTSVDDEELSLSALRLGAADYLVKGEVSAKWLARSLTYAIQRSRIAATEPKAAEPIKNQLARVIDIEKALDADDRFVARINDTRMVSVALMEEIKQRLLNVLGRAECREVHVDLSRVEYVANVAISMLLIVQKKAKGANAELVLCNVSPQVNEHFASRRFDKVFQIVPAAKTV